jgi:hypothetical protein
MVCHSRAHARTCLRRFRSVKRWPVAVPKRLSIFRQRLLNILWLLLVFPAAVAILVGFLGHSATLGIKTLLLIESGVAILSPLLTAILGSRDA